MFATKIMNLLFPKVEIIKELLDEKFLQFNTASFAETEPVQIPRSFSLKEVIEIFCN